ncbi:MAG: hypothetical protein E7293_03385 [Lachnospiraceae bacterium]|nr:hypothetical protein [Lachnospiraceae bacterium]
MKFDCQLEINKKSCMHRLGIDEQGRVQRAIDSTFLMGVGPYVPLDEGDLLASGIANTDIGSGEIVWDVDNKARRLYYGERDWNWSNGGVQQGGLRGPYWAHRYIQEGGREQVERAARRAVGK